jgi:hypothetical protein
VDLKEKIAISAEPNKLTFFKEDLFYKCYNEDAMVFFEHIKEYKISPKYVKTLNVQSPWIITGQTLVDEMNY